MGLKPVSLQEFTNDFDRIAVAIGQLRQAGMLAGGPLLTPSEKDELLVEQIRILRASARFSAEAIAASADALKEQLAGLSAETAAIDETISRFRTVQEIIDLAADAVSAAESLVEGDIPGAAAALEAVVQKLKSIRGKKT